MPEATRPYGQLGFMGGVYIYGVYDPPFTEELKATVPSWAREYDGEQRRWFIGSDFMEEALRLCERAWPSRWRLIGNEQRDSRNGNYRRAEWAAGGSNQRHGSFWEGAWKPPGGDAHHNSARGSPGHETSPDHAALFVASNAPPEVIRAAYRALSKLYHPDTGGSAAQMQTINAAIERLRKAGKA